MAAEAAPMRRLATWAFNPFHYLSGEQALPLGVLIMIATAVVGSMTNTYVDGALDLHGGPPGPLWLHLAEGLIDWVCLGLTLAGIGRWVSPSRPRFIDAFGMPALARAPYLPACTITLLAPACLANLAKTGRPDACRPAEMALLFVVSIVTLLCIVWAVTLMYNAFSLSCNVRGGRGAASFIAALVLAEIVSKVAVFALAQKALGAASP